jgi:Na+/H+ antiporter NhaD/arsenite permease-like protein
MPPALSHVLPLVLFLLTYLGLSLGRLRGLALDRTGWAMLGAMAFLVTGEVPLTQAAQAVDAATLAVLFGMMLLSAQFQSSGLYGAIAARLGRLEHPRLLLAGTIVACAALSAVLTNDVVCFALTPLIAAAPLRQGRDPIPFLAALACAANIGSALTPIGNPQNILIAQRLHLHFLPFVTVCALPVLLSLGFLYLLLARRVDPVTAAAPAATAAAAPAAAIDPLAAAVRVDRVGAWKAVLLAAAAIALFLSPAPAALVALAVGAAVLISRRLTTNAALAQVDWALLALFVSLFIVNRGISLSGWTVAAGDALLRSGVDLSRTAVLVPVAAVLGNLVSNVPAVMLLLPFVAARPAAGYSLALASTLGGNAVLVGSVANLIVAAQAERLGIRFGFREQLRVGLPVTLVSLTLAAAWLALAGLG